MDQLKMIIHYIGEWNGDNYIGGNLCVAVANKNVTFTQLVDIIYKVTKVDRTIFDIKIHSLLQGSANLSTKKYRIKDDYSVRFLVVDQPEYIHVYIDNVVRDFGVSKPIISPCIPSSIPGPTYGQARAQGPVIRPIAKACVPGVDHYKEPIKTFMSTSYQCDTFYKGKIFGSKEALETSFRKYAHEAKFAYQIRRSCTGRFEVSCKDVSCTFEVRVTCKPGWSMWQVMQFVSEHTCSQDTYQSHIQSVKAIIIGNFYSSKVAENVYKLDNVTGEIREQYGVQVFYNRAWRALEYAKKLSCKKVDESYQQLPSYFHMLKVTNPGTITAIETDENNRFLYSFVALAASIKGFRSFIKPVIAIDVTHLESEYTGVIFVATCKDGEEMIYPIAFGFGDDESDNSWIWFLNRLREVTGVPEDLIIISEHHESISNAMKVAFPSVPHVFCLFHLRQNLERHYEQKRDMMDALYAAAYSHLTSECDRYMSEIQRMHAGMYAELIEVGLERWSRSYSPKRRCTMMTINIAKSFNNCVMKACRLPMRNAHEFLRYMIQKWFNDRRAAVAKLTSEVTCVAEAHINAMHALSIESHIYPTEHLSQFLVKHAEKGDGIVDVKARSCSCRKWDLDQLPCLHAVATARHMQVHCRTFCHPYYSAEWLRAAYAPPINPVPSHSAWDVPKEVQLQVVLPPKRKKTTN